jgi:hypothetical protein
MVHCLDSLPLDPGAKPQGNHYKSDILIQFLQFLFADLTENPDAF